MGKRSKPAERVVKTIPIADIATQGGTQTRAELNKATIVEYRELYADGVTMPPPIVYFDGETYWLSDGFHRVAAVDSLKYGGMACEVRKGGVLEAFTNGLSSNLHGLPRTNHDKRFAIGRCFKMQTIREKSDREIARICCVSHTLVADVRSGLSGGIASTQANDSADVTKTRIPVPAPVDISNDGDDPESGPDFLAIEQGEGAGAGPTTDPRGLVGYIEDDRITGTEQPFPATLETVAVRRDPGAPKPCPVCNPSGTSATGGWIPGKAA